MTKGAIGDLGKWKERKKRLENGLFLRGILVWFEVCESKPSALGLIEFGARR
jgi:hypothetical protein